MRPSEPSGAVTVSPTRMGMCLIQCGPSNGPTVRQPPRALERMPNIHTSSLNESAAGRSSRLGELAGSEHLGMTLYELAAGEGTVFHYHLQREELLIVLSGSLSSVASARSS